MGKPWAVIPLLTLFGGLWVATAAANTDEHSEIKALLKRMTEAVRLLDYEGTFVYLQNNQLESLHVEHYRDGEMVRERLLSLNGSPREVVRDGAKVTCIFPDSDAVLVDQPMAQSSFPDLLRSSLDDLADNYRFSLLGQDRVAGRSAQVVAIVPRDNLRYGYRLYLDRDSSLPLKSDLMDENGDPVEQSMFTSLKVADSTLERLEGAELLPPPESAAAPAENPDGSWAFSNLPKGFQLDLHEHRANPRDGDPMEYFLLSDGLASLSVFVEEGSLGDGLQGGSRMGAVSAWGGQVAGHQVTVVGDVPLDTVRLVLQALQPQP